jgi:hypothetical protein
MGNLVDMACWDAGIVLTAWSCALRNILIVTGFVLFPFAC